MRMKKKTEIDPRETDASSLRRPSSSRGFCSSTGFWDSNRCCVNVSVSGVNGVNVNRQSMKRNIYNT